MNIKVVPITSLSNFLFFVAFNKKLSLRDADKTMLKREIVMTSVPKRKLFRVAPKDKKIKLREPVAL